MPSYRTSTVSAVLSERPGLQRVRLDGGRHAYVLTQLIGAVAAGDRVVVNTTAVDLGLGTGGWDVVHWNLSREAWSQPGPGHIMKLRYTSLQVDTGASEETAPGRAADLAGVPVVACSLHSQVACVAVAFSRVAPRARLAYVMTDSAALPIAISELVHDLRQAGLLCATVTAGQAFGGEREAVNTTSAMLAASTIADAVVVGPGPGVVGTHSDHGFSGLEVAAVVDAAARLGGRPVVAVRWSDVDPRPRHQGVSHHTRTALSMAASSPTVPVPAGAKRADVAGAATTEVDVPDMAEAFADQGIAVATMGRSPSEDPGFFRYAAAAGVAAAEYLRAPAP